MEEQELFTISESISAALKASNSPLLISHIRPDGDAIASLFGMGIALSKAGKKCQLILIDGLPSKYKFLASELKVSKKIQPGYDLVIAMDCSDKDRMGKPLNDLSVDINIDHHITNDHFAKHNLVLPKVPATAAILAQYLPEWGYPLTPVISNTLLTGILTDTIGFRTTNVTPDTLRLAAQLMENGANLTNLYEKALISQSFSASMLWGYALSRLKKKNGIVWTSITLEDRKRAKYSGRDDADLSNQLSAIENMDASILFNEQNNCKIKVSWRSGEEINVAVIAQHFGGGGHPPAAGAEISGNLEEVEEMVLKITKQYVKEQKSKGENKNGK
jgi:phosphoesterase RecJ-like protein